MSHGIAADLVGPGPAPHAPIEPSDDALLAALPGPLGPIRRSRAFRVRLLLCACVLLALMIIYAGLVVVSSYGLWTHAASPKASVLAHRIVPEPMIFAFLCIAGPVLCVFLVKPLFSLRAERPPHVKLVREREPFLFAFVDRLCEAQGAPRPREILVDTQVNASASLRHGLLGLFRDDLTLTIGLPLVTGMTLSEFTGVLAHEFGHFAQGGAMRLSTLIRRSVHVMQRVVHERDGFDALLLDAGQIRLFLDPRLLIASLLFSALIWLIIGFLSLARLLLKGLAWMGMASASALLRQMEYDADAHEVRIVGRATYLETAERLLLLDAARRDALLIEQRSWAHHRLPDDLPRLVATLSGRIREEPNRVQALRDEAYNRPAGRLDTHPSFSQRAAAVEAGSEVGAFRLDVPASALFRNLSELSREATQAFYREHLTFEYKAVRFLPVDEILFQLEGDPLATRRLARLTQGCESAAFEVAIGTAEGVAPVEDPALRERLAQDLQRARQAVVDLAPSAARAATRRTEARRRQDRFSVVSALLRSGFPIDPGPVPPGLSPEQAQVEGRKEAALEIQSAEAELAPFHQALSDRLTLALRLRPVGPGQGEIEAMVASLQGLVAARSRAAVLDSQLNVVRGLLWEAERERGSPLVVRPLYSACHELSRTVVSYRSVVDAVAYPFPFVLPEAARQDQEINVGLFLGPHRHDDQPAATSLQAMQLLIQVRRVEERIVGSLAELVERVEDALGWPPLPDPAPIPSKGEVPRTVSITVPHPVPPKWSSGRSAATG